MKKWPMILLFACSLCAVVIIRFNLFFNIRTDSMPIGIYRQVNDKAHVGSLVATCLTEKIAQYGLERGYLMKGKCATGIQPVLKKIYAVEGDYVSIGDGRVSINGEVYYELPVLSTDSKGRAVKQFGHKEYYLKSKEYFLLSDYKDNSWDSRYWGSVPVDYVVKPLVVLDE